MSSENLCRAVENFDVGLSDPLAVVLGLMYRIDLSVLREPPASDAREREAQVMRFGRRLKQAVSVAGCGKEDCYGMVEEAVAFGADHPGVRMPPECDKDKGYDCGEMGDHFGLYELSTHLNALAWFGRKVNREFTHQLLVLEDPVEQT
jgi:hypothetical protein